MSRTSVVLALWFVSLSFATLWGHAFELFYFAGIRAILEVFWGRLVLLDFAASLVLIGVWITYLHPPEQRLTRGVPWALAVLVLGTPPALFFFLLRARKHPTALDTFLRWPTQSDPEDPTSAGAEA